LLHFCRPPHRRHPQALHRQTRHHCRPAPLLGDSVAGHATGSRCSPANTRGSAGKYLYLFIE
jgi:hypothetical protein